MTSNKATAIWVGIFFIIATVMGTLNAGMVGPIIGDDNYLTLVSENQGLVRISALFNVIMVAAIIAIAVVLYPILKRTSETLAIGYLAARIVEGIMIAIAGVAWLVLIPLSSDFLQSSSLEAPHLQALGDMLVTSSTSTFTLGTEIVFGVTALILNYELARTKLVPRLISVWGLIGGALLLALGVLHLLDLFGSTLDIAFTVPIALNEMVLAVWLIAKGFNTTTASQS